MTNDQQSDNLNPLWGWEMTNAAMDTKEQAEEIKRIGRLSVMELIEYVISHPEYLIEDSYTKLGEAIRNRYETLAS